MKQIDLLMLAELKRGNHASFRKIFDYYSPAFFQFSLSYLKSKEAAEDVVQEVFLRI
jgi:RNA polymerase sigma-70 factor (ECF subfamily)